MTESIALVTAVVSLITALLTSILAFYKHLKIKSGEDQLERAQHILASLNQQAHNLANDWEFKTSKPSPRKAINQEEYQGLCFSACNDLRTVAISALSLEKVLNLKTSAAQANLDEALLTRKKLDGE